MVWRRRERGDDREKARDGARASVGVARVGSVSVGETAVILRGDGVGCNVFIQKLPKLFCEGGGGCV